MADTENLRFVSVCLMTTINFDFKLQIKLQYGEARNLWNSIQLDSVIIA